MTGQTATVRRRKVSAKGFSRVEPGGGSLVEEVAAQIRERIEVGEFHHGERLPSERDLADELGISRTVLRESLRSLESLGYLEAHVGQGRYVVDPRDQWTSQRLIDDWLRRHRSELRDLIELRAAIESQALRGGSGDSRELASSVQELLDAQARAIAEARADDAAEIDTTFHIRLASSTENRPLRSLAIAIILRASKAAHAAYRVSAYKQGSLRQHRAIVSALLAGQRDRAADLLAEHHHSRVEQLAGYLERAESTSDAPADTVIGTSSRPEPG